MPAEPRVTLVQGDDATLVAQGARSAIRDLLGDRDPGLCVEELGGATADELDVGQIIDSLMTPAFLVDRRIVVLRDAGRLVTADGKRLAEAIPQIPDTSFLVLVGGGGTVPAPLVAAVKEHGVQVATSVGTGRQRSNWLHDRLERAPVRLDTGAADLVGAHLGDDVGRLESLLEVLAAAYGEGSKVSAGDVAPFLGEAGNLPPWDLTDAIDDGSPERALEVVGRMLDAGGRAGPEIVGTLHRHYEQMLKLDGTGARTKEEAKAILQARSDFAAGKALRQAQRLGTRGITDALILVGRADVEVKGMTGLEPHVVLEVLVARLARLGGTHADRRRRTT